MQKLGDAQAPPKPEDLLRTLSPALKVLIESDVDGDSDPEKTWQYSTARRNYMMYRGMPFLSVGNNNGVVDFVPVGNAWSNGAGGGNSTDSCYDYQRNIIRGYGNKFTAVVGQRSPNVTAVADDPQDEKSMRACRHANEGNAILNSWWSVDEKNIELAFWLWTTGPAYLYTPWNADGEMYGYREEPKYRTEQQPMGEPFFRCMFCGAESPQPGQCAGCGQPIGPESLVEPEMVDVPVLDGVTKYPNGRVECYVLDCTTVTTPFYAKSDLKYCPWLKYEYEENRSFLIQKWPKLREKSESWSDDGALTEVGRDTRAAMVSPSGTAMRASRSRWKYSRVWIQAKMYNLVKDEEQRKLLVENYPDGLKISRVNGEIMELESERLDAVWSAVQPSAAANLNSDPVMQDLVSAQLLINHTLNIAAETIERGNALTFVDPRVVNFEQWNRHSSKPNAVIPTMAAVGSTLAESFYQTQASRFSEQMEPWIQGVEAGAVQDVGTTPQIFGGGSAATAREAEINKNAAMMQLGIVWTYIRKGWERAKRNGIMQLVKYGPAQIREGRNLADLAEITSGAWHFESDEAIPATWGQQRDFVMFMMGQPAEVQAAWGLPRPENIALNKSLLGMTGMYTPGLDDRDKTMDTIQQLLQAAPVQQQGPDGSVSLEPSIPADEFEDNHELVVQLVQGWAQKAGLSGGERERNPDGYANVIAWGVAHQKFLNPPAPEPAPPAPKVSVSVSSKDLAPNQTAAILGDVKLQVPPPELPPQLMPPPGPQQPPSMAIQ
jgi:hypothetical protein